MNRDITTRRLRLTPFTEGDVGQLRELVHEPGVRRYLCDDELLPDERIDAWVRESAQSFADGDAGVWTMRPIDERPVIGFAGFMTFYEPPVREFAFAVSEEHWRRGFATEAAQAVIEWARANVGYETIRASTDEPNVASIGALERLGFTLQSTTVPPEAGWKQLHFELPGRTRE